jgi:hypothetical protein
LTNWIVNTFDSSEHLNNKQDDAARVVIRNFWESPSNSMSQRQHFFLTPLITSQYLNYSPKRCYYRNQLDIQQNYTQHARSSRTQPAIRASSHRRVGRHRIHIRLLFPLPRGWCSTSAGEWLRCCASRSCSSICRNTRIDSFWTCDSSQARQRDSKVRRGGQPLWLHSMRDYS